MHEWVDASKTAEGRHMLLSSGQVTAAALQTADLLSSRRCTNEQEPVGCVDSSPDLLLLLRLLRNCCALGGPAAAILLQHDLHKHVAQLAAQLAATVAGSSDTHGNGISGVAHSPAQQQQQQQQMQMLLAAVQLLSNLASTGPSGAAAVWAALFPGHLSSILAVHDTRVHEAAALTALSCSRASSSTTSSSTSTAQQDLSSPTARTAWLQLLAPLMQAHADEAVVPPPQQDSAAAAANNPAQLQASEGSSTGVATASCPAPAAAAANGGGQHSPATERAATTAVATGNDNVCLLVKFLAMQTNHLQQIMQVLSSPAAVSAAVGGQGNSPAAAAAQDDGSTLPGDTAKVFQATELHAVLLHVVALEAAAVPAASPLPGVDLGAAAPPSSDCQTQQESSSAGHVSAHSTSSSSSDWLQYTVGLLQVVWAQALAAVSSTAGPVCSQPSATAHALEATLQVLKAVLARDEDTEGGGQGKEAEAAAAAGLAAVAQYLHRIGLLQQLLDMLKALGPPPKSKQQQQQREYEQQQQQQQQQGEQQQPPPQEPQTDPQHWHQQPYSGYRADVVAVLSNLLLGGHDVQAAVMAAGGIELLLNNCNLDETSPMAREWALWGIRNACKDNVAVQAYVSQFQAVDAVQSAELDKMGMQLELDQLTHKLKLVKKQEEQ